jgi:L-alanine-DL-glutamate epimerase-like enolase superfamily enzyme
MPAIASVRTDLYRIALPVVLSDSTHGDMSHFELVTVRIVDAEGAEGVGYTYTVGVNGVAVHATVERDLAPLLAGREAADIAAAWRCSRSPRSTSRCGTSPRSAPACRCGGTSAASTRGCRAMRAAST